MNWEYRRSSNMVHDVLNIWDRWGIKVVLNKYWHLENLPFHDHRQNFVSFIVKGGYKEVRLTEPEYKHKTIRSPNVIHRHRDVVHQVSVGLFTELSPCITLQVYYGKKKKQKVI